MNHRVAVHARTATSILGGIRSDETALVARRYWAIWGVAVMRTVVALRAHERRTRLQQGKNVTRAMYGNSSNLPKPADAPRGMARAFSAWQVKQVSFKVFFFSIFGPAEPCELWQSEQAILPAASG